MKYGARILLAGVLASGIVSTNTTYSQSTAQETTPTDRTKSIPFVFRSRTQIDQASPADPDKIWAPEDLKLDTGAQSPGPVGEVSLFTYSAKGPDGEHIISVLNSQDECSSSECPARHVILKADGTHITVETQMEPFAAPSAGAERSGVAPATPFSLSADGKQILVTPEMLSRALRGESEESLIQAGIPRSCAPFAAKVSASEGLFKTKSRKNCLGAFQFCPGTFEMYYSGSAAQFLADPPGQVKAWTRYEKTQWGQATKNQLTKLVDSTVCSGANCAKIDNSAILMGCQFGCGKYGKLANYLALRTCDSPKVKDGFGTSVCTYLIRGAGYEVGCFTGGTTPVEADVASPPPSSPAPVDVQAPAGPQVSNVMTTSKGAANEVEITITIKVPSHLFSQTNRSP